MPAFISEQTLFLHVPKTGGTWVTSAALAAGIHAVAPEASGGRVAHSTDVHPVLADLAHHDGRFRVAFVRHPLDWYRSYWGHRMREGVWRDDIELDRLAGHLDFREFIARVVERLPGHLSASYEQYVGTAGNEVDFVGRYEHLADDLCLALRLAGETFDESALRAVPAENVSDYARHPALYERDLALALARSERRAIERYYPSQVVPEHVLNGRPRHAGDSANRGGELAVLARQLDRATLLLRDANAERAAAQRTNAKLAHELDATRAALAEERTAHAATARALDLLRHSRILRLSRPLRLVYYRAKRVDATAADLRAPGSDAAAPRAAAR